VQCRVGDTFIERGKITVAFCYLMARAAAPDPAVIIALKEIPNHCCTPLAVQLISTRIAVWPLHTLIFDRAMLRMIVRCGVSVLLLLHVV
jgi:hypothetical protein